MQTLFKILKIQLKILESNNNQTIPEHPDEVGITPL